MTTSCAHAAPSPLYLSVLMILVSRPALQDESANCGRTVVATPQGRIASPGYPLSYPPGSQCSYRIIPSGSRVCAALLRFEDLDLVCPGDALTVPSTGDRFCGVNPPESLGGCRRVVPGDVGARRAGGSHIAPLSKKPGYRWSLTCIGDAWKIGFRMNNASIQKLS